MKLLILIFMFPLAAFSQLSEKWFSVRVDLKLLKPAERVFIRYRVGDEVLIDSAVSNHGVFTFEGKIKEPVVADLRVRFQKKNTDEVPEVNDMQFVLTSGQINISAKDSLSNHKITGSAANTDLEALQKAEKPFTDQMEQLYPVYSKAESENDNATKSKIEKQLDSIDESMREKVYYKYLTENPNSTLAVYALRQYAGFIIDPEKAENAFNLLPNDKKEWPSAIELKNRINIARKTEIGSYALDFTQNDTLDHPVRLSSFRGKYVLLDFWASWCRPCRMENPNVVKTFNEFRDKNFTVLSVSLDRPGQKERWIKAIHDDGLTWNHVSDLKFWNNAVAVQYGINDIPQNLLIDPQGKIIAKNLRGEELEKKLKEFLTPGP